jgi:hypothetical protein
MPLLAKDLLQSWETPSSAIRWSDLTKVSWSYKSSCASTS